MTSACQRCYLLYRSYELIGDLESGVDIILYTGFCGVNITLVRVTFLLEPPSFYIPFGFFTDFDTISHPTMQYCVHLGSGIYAPFLFYLGYLIYLGWVLSSYFNLNYF